MKCPCGVDHWSHLAAGFKGIVTMMQNLRHNNVPCTDHGLATLEEQLALLKEQIELQKGRKEEARANPATN